MNLRAIPGYVALLLGLRRDERAGFHMVTRLARRLVPDYRFTWPELAWFRDARVTRVLARFNESEGFNAHRRFALQQLLRLTAGVPGDTAECGVFRGCGSYIILQSSQRASVPRVHHIFDSFEGLSAPSSRDGAFWAASDLSVGETTVRENLREFSAVQLHKGWIPERFGDVADRTFSFVHVDVDLYQPTRDSLEFFYDRLNPGAVLVCDDYGFLTCPGATSAVDAFLESRPEKMVFLPGGGGFIVKGCATSTE